MTSAPSTTWKVAAVGLSCAVAALSYSGAVTLFALYAFVLPAVVLVTVVTAAVARRSVRLSAAAGLAAALGLAEIVNVVSGTGNGPAARSTFAAAAFAALAVTAAMGPAPALFALAVVGVVVGALGLGAGSEVAPVAVATAVVLIVALAIVEATGRRWTRRPPQLAAVLVLAALVGTVVAGIALQADRRLDGEPAVLAPGAVQPSIRPPQVLGDPDPQPTPDVEQTPTDGSNSASANESTVPLGTIWLAVLLVLLTVLLGGALRMAWVSLSWRRLRRRLRRGSERDQVAGAWVWATRRLRAAGWPMPASLSADAVGSDHGIEALPRALRIPLRQVAGATADAVFAPPVENPDPAAPWIAADEVGRGAVKALPPARRLGFALRSVSSVPSHTAASESARPEETHL